MWDDEIPADGFCGFEWDEAKSDRDASFPHERLRGESGVTTKRISNAELRRTSGRIDRAKVRATTEADVQRHITEDGGIEASGLSGSLFLAPEYLRRLRKDTGLTRAAFAKRYGLSERTLEEWERGRQAPTGAARTLLIVIAREPRAVERALATTRE